MIFQEAMTSLNPVFTIGQQIVEALTIHRSISGPEAQAEAISLLERAKIPAARSRYNGYPHKRLLSAVRYRIPTDENTKHALTAREIKNPIRARDYAPPERHYRALSDSHFVMVEQIDTA
ncbi:hypothetical protein [Ensifer aridi]|uniref:hypothetical protein n=1 Tax=Ensifer aridi TaxID=1708715 RepID=UPI000A0FFC1C